MISLFLLLLPEVLEAEDVGPLVFQNDFKIHATGRQREKGVIFLFADKVALPLKGDECTCAELAAASTDHR